MSIFALLLRSAYKISGAKKAFRLPEDEILKIIEKQNRSRGISLPFRPAKYRGMRKKNCGCRL